MQSLETYDGKVKPSCIAANDPFPNQDGDRDVGEERKKKEEEEEKREGGWLEQYEI